MKRIGLIIFGLFEIEVPQLQPCEGVSIVLSEDGLKMGEL